MKFDVLNLGWLQMVLIRSESASQPNTELRKIDKPGCFNKASAFGLRFEYHIITITGCVEATYTIKLKGVL